MQHLEVYLHHSESTNPGEFTDLLKKTPSTLEAILQHINAALLFSFPQKDMTEAQKKDIAVATAEDILRTLKNRGNSFEPGGPKETRLVGLCYHWSLLATSILRSKGYACRARCGFALYLGQNKKGIDHTIVELWEPARKRWRLVDPELIAIRPDVSMAILKISKPLDTQDISLDHFHSAARAWMNYRQKTVTDGFYGLGGDGPSYNFVRASLIRDWLNILGHERNVSCNPPLKGLGHEQEMVYLDSIATLMLDPDADYGELKRRSTDLDFDVPSTDENSLFDLRPIPKD